MNLCLLAFWKMRMGEIDVLIHNHFVYAILYERGGFLNKPLQPIVQEMAQVKVGDTIVVVAGE